MSTVALWLALWLTPSALVLLWIAADTWLACLDDEAERQVEAADLGANVVAFDRLGKEANR